jgi:hypothetical protein
MAKVQLTEALRAEYQSLFEYAPGKVIAAAIELQRFLNRFPGIYLKEDGTLGDSTSEACKRVFGRYLLGDPRNR